jgi:NADPH:quinone reductase-like Zn-dependent oxidoreductase
MKLKRVLGWTALAIPIALFLAFLVAYLRSTNACADPGRAPPRDPMKAIVYCDYGPPDVLRLEDVEKPIPAPDQILVRVHAAAANPLDWHYIRGTPYVMRLMAGLRKPAEIRIGADYAGTVEAVGSDVTNFKPGDEVFGVRTGAFAEYVVARAAGGLTLKPPGVSFEDAAAVPVAASTAYQALKQGGVGPGDRILVNGASGGVGTYMIQLAKTMGAHVTGVCSTRNVALVRSLGADHVIDYKKENYTEQQHEYDVIIDNVGNHGLLANRRALKDDGKFVLIGGGGPEEGQWIGPMIAPVKALILSPFISQEMGSMLAEVKPEELAEIGQLIAAGRVRSVIDRRFSLAEVPDAIRYLETGRARGKVIITPN